VIFGAVEARRAHPVLEREVVGVADPEAALLGGIDEKEPAERPERLPAERLLGLLLEDRDPAPGIRQFGGRDQPGEPGADDDDVRQFKSLPAARSARSAPPP
jgi:hypothetical protein